MADDHRALTNPQVISLAWKITGGSKAMISGGDFWITFVLWALCFPAWIDQKWWDQPISVLPNLLGFTLGGFAIFLGFGSDSFKNQITEADQYKSPYLSVSAAFLIFVLAQCGSLLYAIVCAALWRPTPNWLGFMEPVFSYGNPIFWGIGYFGFLYSIVLSMRAAIRIFRLSRWYNSFLVHSRPPEVKVQSTADQNPHQSSS